VEHLEQLPDSGLARRETGHLLVPDVIVHAGAKASADGIATAAALPRSAGAGL
jgi:hypothetical protein